MSNETLIMLLKAMVSVERNWGRLPDHIEDDVYKRIPLHLRYGEAHTLSLEIGNHAQDMDDVQEAIRTDSCTPYHLAHIGEMFVALAHQMLQHPGSAAIAGRQMTDDR